MSYNLDLECFLAGDGTCQQVCQESAKDICAEPSFGSGPPVAIVPRTFYFQIFTRLDTSPVGVLAQYLLPSTPGLSLPVGLRAPPLKYLT